MPKTKKQAQSDSSDSDSGPEDVSVNKSVILFSLMKSRRDLIVILLILTDIVQWHLVHLLQRTPAKKAKKTENGETKFDLGKNRQVTVRAFKGKTYIDIRYDALKSFIFNSI